MKVHFLFFIIPMAIFQFMPFKQLHAQAFNPPNENAGQNLKHYKGNKLKELPDPQSINWKQDVAIGDQLFSQGNIYSSLQYYQVALTKNPKETKLYELIADGNFSLRDYKLAGKYYKALVEMDSVKHSNWHALYNYALTEKYQGNYEKSKLLFSTFLKYYKNEKELDGWRRKAARESEGCDLGIKWRDDKSLRDLNIVHLGKNINQPFTDYAPVLIDSGTLYFSSLISDTAVITAMGERLPVYSRIYSSTKTGNGWNPRALVKGELNTLDYHVGNPAISADGKTMYYTRCMEREELMSCEIYKSFWGDSGWQAGIILDEHVNARGASNTQPALGKNESGENVLFFVSDRNKDQGTDLFEAKLNKDGSFEHARKVPGPVNTDGNELTPFYDFETSTLYFSSDGHVNIGGADVFKTRAVNGSWTEPVNLGPPVNSSVDDIYYSWYDKQALGFVVSNRPGGFGLKSETCCDDIYELSGNHFYPAVEGSIVDEDSNTLIKNQLIYLVDPNTDTVIKVYNSPEGAYFFGLAPDKEYKLRVAREGYFATTKTFNTRGKSMGDTSTLVVRLKRLVKNKTYALNNIYYEFDKWDLTPFSELVLDTLSYILKDNPKIVIELSSHTDGMGTDNFNMELSQKRAESCAAYLIKEKGIAANRIVPKGYGKSLPIAPNTNPDGSDNPEGREKNRRTEFKIIMQ